MKAKRYLVSGIVQGVGYRYFALTSAIKLGLRGYVTNLYDGRVEAYAIGDEKTLELFKIYLEKGPRSARVTEVIVSDDTIDEKYSTFVVE